MRRYTWKLISDTHTNTVCQMYNLNSATAKKWYDGKLIEIVKTKI